MHEEKSKPRHPYSVGSRNRYLEKSSFDRGNKGSGKTTQPSYHRKTTSKTRLKPKTQNYCTCNQPKEREKKINKLGQRNEKPLSKSGKDGIKIKPRKNIEAKEPNNNIMKENDEVREHLIDLYKMVNTMKTKSGKERNILGIRKVQKTPKKLKKDIPLNELKNVLQQLKMNLDIINQENAFTKQDDKKNDCNLRTKLLDKLKKMRKGIDFCRGNSGIVEQEKVTSLSEEYFRPKDSNITDDDVIIKGLVELKKLVKKSAPGKFIDT